MGGCTRLTRSPGGLIYSDEPREAERDDIGPQLDKAWLRALGTAQGCGSLSLTAEDLARIHDALEITVWAGIIHLDGRAYWGLSDVYALSTELADVGGRVPAAAHEFYHQLLNASGVPGGDPTHIRPCWNRVNGDTP